jgi:hypothetical protein
LRDPLTRGFYKENAYDLRGVRGVRFGFAHVKAAKDGKVCERQC